MISNDVTKIILFNFVDFMQMYPNNIDSDACPRKTFSLLTYPLVPVKMNQYLTFLMG